MKLNSFFKTFLLSFVVLFFVSCDKDFNEIGTNIIGDDHYDFLLNDEQSVIAYNQPIGAVQSNNLPLNALGYYNSPVFGKTKASFVTQLELIAANPTFVNPSALEIDSVYLYVPYFSTFKSTTTAGDKLYELDSIYGNNPIRLDIYESNYYLRDFDASSGLEQIQRYYSDQKPLFDANHGANRLNNSTEADENNEFVFKPTEIKLQYINDEFETIIKERLLPGLFVDIDKDFIRNKIINAPAGQLINNNTFKNYFRGLYFEANNAASSATQGSLALLNFREGKIVIVYHDETTATNPDRIRKELTIKLNGNSVNLFENENTPTSANYNAAMANNTPDTPTGDEKLYIKGQNGAMTVIELFGPDLDDNNIPDELEAIKANGWMINEASLTFYIERDAMFTTEEPLRIYLYDLKNNVPIVDYTLDRSSGASTKFDKIIHGGILEVEEDVVDARGTQYKIRLTNHLRSLIADEDPSENVKLGLVVTESITAITNAKIKTPITTNNTIEFTPIASVMNPLGTVLYGSSVNVPEEKRLKLKIYYTKPE